MLKSVLSLSLLVVTGGDCVVVVATVIAGVDVPKTGKF